MTNAPPDGRVSGYGRARLWVGITAVGSIVTLATVALVAGLPAAVDQRVGPGLGSLLLALAAYAASHAAIQLPFDLFGGYLLPVRYSRRHDRTQSVVHVVVVCRTAHPADCRPALWAFLPVD